MTNLNQARSVGLRCVASRAKSTKHHPGTRNRALSHRVGAASTRDIGNIQNDVPVSVALASSLSSLVDFIQDVAGKQRALKPGRPGASSPETQPNSNGTRTPLTRRTVLRSFALPTLASLTMGSDDPTTLLNSVLAGYGLPKLPGSTGFKLLDDFELEFTLEYPRSWVVRPNTLRQGVYISDFNTADKLSVEVFPVPPEGDVVMAAVTAAVVPGAGAGQQDDKLLLPPPNKVKSRTATVDGKEYTFIQFPSETVTRSGYQIRRKNFAVAAVKRGVVYTLNASSRTDQFNKDKEALLLHVVESFRVR